MFGAELLSVLVCVVYRIKAVSSTELDGAGAGDFGLVAGEPAVMDLREDGEGVVCEPFVLHVGGIADGVEDVMEGELLHQFLAVVHVRCVERIQVGNRSGNIPLYCSLNYFEKITIMFILWYGIIF